MDFDFERAELAFGREPQTTKSFERQLRARQLRALERIADALEDLTGRCECPEEDSNVERH
jgi:hypothetical protein